jgi:aminocarboxymuconate-semialdehyde decarboxylase
MTKPVSGAKRSAAPSAKTRTAARSRRPTVIDFHAHVVMPEVLAETYPRSLFATVVQKKRADGTPEPLPESQMRAMTDIGQRLRDMDAMGIDIQVICPSILHQCSYSLDENLALRIERLSNDRVAETVAHNSDRLVGIGSVPLQNVELAVAELERAVRELGLKGVIISSHVNGTELGDASLRPFWAKVQELDAAVLVHPAGGTDERLKRHRRLTSFGQQIEETFALSSLVYDGVLDEFPRIKIAFSHGGGFLPYYAGRLDFFHRKGYSPQLRGDLSSYLRRLYYDGVVFSPDMLEFLVAKATASHVMMGTDYPFGETDPVGLVRRARRLSRQEQDAILGANAASFLGIRI